MLRIAKFRNGISPLPAKPTTRAASNKPRHAGIIPLTEWVEKTQSGLAQKSPRYPA
jgi:hypothetical protein